jgi:hypothetical protein
VKTRAGASQLSAETMHALRREAVASALGISPGLMAASALADPPEYLEGKAVTTDNSINKKVPMANLKVVARMGSAVYTTHTTTTSSSGHIVLPYPEDWGWGDLSFIFQDPLGRWKITTNSLPTVPYELYMGLLNNFWNISNPQIVDINIPNNNQYQIAPIHRAVNYFYNVQNVFPKKYNTNGGTPIIAYSGLIDPARPNVRGSFVPNYYVNISNRGDSNGWIIGATLHELGHVSHYHSAPFRHIGLYESFACYAGWYLGEEYYKSQGWSQNSALDITGVGSQKWTKYHPVTSSYFPLFIDLTDNYNQWSSSDPDLLKDNIKGVTAAQIWNIITTSNDWTQCRDKIENLVGTSVDFDDWIGKFDYWFDNN